jgi:hypothetical protein
VLKNTRTDVKILGQGELKKKLTVTAHSFSASAREKIEGVGGTATALRAPVEKKRRVRKAKPAQPSAPAEEPEATEEPEAEGEGRAAPEDETTGEPEEEA